MSVVTKWGNSLAVRIPKNLASQINLKEGSSISITVKEGNIVISPKRKKYTLEELLEGTSPDDFGGEIDWGEPVGVEVW